MTRLSLSLLGTWQVTLDGEPITAFESDKVRALLAYLAVESDRPHRRESLATLFWPERPERNARQNLSQALFNLRQVIADRKVNPSFLLITQQSIQFNQNSDHWLDTAVFTHHHHTCEAHLHHELENCRACLVRLQEAAALYQGDFLPGFSLADSIGFEEWLLLKREQYHRLAVTTMAQLVAAYEQQGNFAEALAYAWRQEALEPWHEDVHQSLMRLLACNGRRSQALTQYEKCRQLLWEEFGADPSAETITLYEAIRKGEWGSRQGNSSVQEPAKTRRNQLILLDKVETFWIKGMLAQTLAGSRPIKVSKQRYDTVVARPWEDVIRPPSGEDDTILAGKTMGELFAAADQALLILGDPGSGKTVALLQLARELVDQARLNAETPIPVVFNLASWAESSRITIADWVVGELVMRYQIPRRMGRAWLEHHELLLLLDGLDEVPALQRDGCIRAINDFRAEYGLMGIVICCRREDYEASQARLRMSGAVLLRPLTTAQIDAYLATGPSELASLRLRLQRDSAWQELAQTPLMLNMMRLVYGEEGKAVDPETAVAPGKSQADYQHNLLSTYVKQMLSRRQAHSTYNPQEIKQGLAWLAHQMNRHNQSIFLIEQMQPSWLSGRQRWYYLLLSRLVSGFYIGVLLWLTFQATRLLAPQLQSSIEQALFIQLLNQALPWHIFLSFIVLNLALGLVVAVLDGWHFERRLSHQDDSRLDPHLGQQQTLITGLVVCVLVTLYYDPLSQPLIAFGSGFLEAILITYGSYFQNSQSYRTEISPVEALGWSWPDAMRGLVPGAAVGLVIGGLGWLLFGRPFALASGICMGVIFVVQGGLQHIPIETKSLPNQGIQLSIRNGLLVAILLGLLLGPLTGLIWGANFGLLMGVLFVFGGGMAHGGQQAVRHGLVRLLLRINGRLPLRLISFLDTAADHVLLHKVGGGYVFIHQLLQKHFAELY